MTSHKDCTHPSTKAGRTACRKGSTTDGTPTTGTDQLARPSKNEATEKLRSTIKASKAAKAAEANAARLAATKAKAATKQRATKTDCYICSTPAGWIEKSTGEPICMKHVDFKNALILPL